MINEESVKNLPTDVKYIFDEIATELADALRNVKQIEGGTTKEETKKLAHYSANMIRRAGKICSGCGIRAKGLLESVDSN